MAGHYTASLARIHAAAYTDRLHAAVPWLLDRVRESALPGAAVLHDLGCGDGTLLMAAREARITASGSDISPAFVNMGLARGLKIVLAPARTGPWDPGTTALTALGEVLSYLDKREPSFWDTMSLAAGTLRRGGIVIADLIGPSVVSGEHVNSGTGWYMRSATRIEGDILIRTIDIEGPGQPRRVEHRQKIIEPDRVVEALDLQGFDVEILRSYGDVALIPGRFGILARRR